MAWKGKGYKKKYLIQKSFEGKVKKVYERSDTSYQRTAYNYLIIPIYRVIFRLNLIQPLVVKIYW